jgi:hypothetical protein
MTQETDKEIEDIMVTNGKEKPDKDKKPYISNHTGYGYKGSENFEHDDTGGAMNYSGVVDDVYDSLKEHEDWDEGYDY